MKTGTINKLDELMEQIISTDFFSTQEVNDLRLDIVRGLGWDWSDYIRQTRNNYLIKLYIEVIDSIEEEEYADEDYHDEIYMIESEDGRTFYDYDDVEIVNSLINQGLDCIVYKASLEGLEDFSLSNSSDIAQLDNLDWEKMCSYKA